MSTQVDHKETDTTYRRIQEKMDGDGGRVEQPSPKQRSSTICTMLGFVQLQRPVCHTRSHFVTFRAT